MQIKNGVAVNRAQPLKFKAVIPSVHQRKELLYAIEKTAADWIMLKLGDINTLPQLVGHIHRAGKKVMVHQDSIKGIARDKMGIQYMANCGVDCVITMKSQCMKYIKESGMMAAFGFFGLYFLWRRHRPGVARLWLGVVLTAGLLFGGAQLARGAHYPSHTMWSAWLCWAVCVAADALFRWRAARHP